jgi:ABC-type transport system substrate-binding protein
LTADYPLALGTTGTGADGDLRLNYLKSSFAPNGLNWNYWSHPRVEELVPAIMETFDDAKRQAMLKEVQEIAGSDVIIIGRVQNTKIKILYLFLLFLLGNLFLLSKSRRCKIVVK